MPGNPLFHYQFASNGGWPASIVELELALAPIGFNEDGTRKVLGKATVDDLVPVVAIDPPFHFKVRHENGTMKSVYVHPKILLIYGFTWTDDGMSLIYDRSSPFSFPLRPGRMVFPGRLAWFTFKRSLAYALFAAIPLAIIIAILSDRRWIKPKASQCHECGYQLRGCRSAQCPECGTAIMRDRNLEEPRLVRDQK